MSNVYVPWAYLDDYRGKVFTGTWPTLPEAFKITVSRYGDRPCFTIFEPGRITLTYNEAYKIIRAVARWLHSRGIKKGDTVALTGKNSPEWAVSYIAIHFAGGVVVPIDYQLKTEEMDLLLKTSKARVLFVDEEKHERYTQNPGVLTDIISLKKGIGTYVYDLDGPEADIEQPQETDLAAILFTSGTTGVPKGVMLTHANFLADNYLAQSHLVLFPSDVFYALLPIHHAYSMTVFIVVMAVGAELVFGKRMVTKAILKDLKEAKITLFLGVPMLFNKLLAGIMRGIKEKGPIVFALVTIMMGISGFIKKTFKINPGKKMFHFILEQASLTTVKTCICGGGPLAASIFRKYNQLGINFIQGYGLTETSPIINLNPIEHYKEASVGKVIPQVDMKVLNPDERGVGEIIVKGPVVMKGYYEMPEETAAAFTEDGYLKTGDLGYLDSENYLYLTGRAKNIIVTEGGKNVYPEEIENEFQLFEEIEQILVRGFVLDKRLKTEGIEALVYPNPEFFKGPSGNEEETAALKEEIKARIDKIIVEVNQRLLPYQRIERVQILDEPMEMTTTKKIKRDAV
ncbi:MAG: AMP-binding protein [Spirochaetaceae bacterium]|jgi:long-chain acyl-CoA synthetase|nr:AMP-binding protein [Spirochaetaceae bacterium]